MKREFLTTGDGSVTIHLPEWNEQYHSKHGAIAEARHVFIASGLHHVKDQFNSPLQLLEIGFGTGLNAYLTLQEAMALNLPVHYTGIEAYPVAASELKNLNYTQLLDDQSDWFDLIHALDWSHSVALTPYFELKKKKIYFREVSAVSEYHLIYFDAFGPRVQPELWTEEIFAKMYTALKPGGVLVTYSAKGSVRRAMQTAGFIVERLPGPPFKREMLRASKPS